jgi:hypothetical protein
MVSPRRIRGATKTPTCESAVLESEILNPEPSCEIPLTSDDSIDVSISHSISDTTAIQENQTDQRNETLSNLKVTSTRKTGNADLLPFRLSRSGVRVLGVHYLIVRAQLENQLLKLNLI